MIEAMKQALEALYPISHNNTDDYRGQADKAITSLRQAMEQAERQQALDKKAENARELGLDYEPVPWIESMTIDSTNELSKPTTPVQAEKQEPVAHRYCCHSCFKASGGVMLDRMILCPECGNKRCPKASDHSFSCTGSNEPGQIGSIYSVSATVFVQEPATDEEMKRAKPVCADFFSFRAGVRYAESKFKEKRS